MRISAVLVVVLGLAAFSPAHADLVYDFTGAAEFSGSGAPALIGTVKVTISDIAGGVNILIEASGLLGDLKQVYLNIDPYPGDAGPELFLDPDGNFVAEADQDTFQADGDGIYDLLLDWVNPGPSSGNWNLIFIRAGLDETDFNALSAPGGGKGPFLAAIHVGDVRGENTDSGWYAPTNGVPEPATLILFGLGAGFIALRKRR